MSLDEQQLRAALRAIRDQDAFTSIRAIENAICDLKGECVSCGEPLKRGDVHSFDHDGGVRVANLDSKQWVYFSCRSCAYDNALWKVVQQILRRVKTERKDLT